MSDVQTYFIQAGEDGPVKIGISADPAKRLREMQTGNPVALRLLGNLAGAHHERELHERFAKDRLKGEWFSCSPELLEVALKAEEERQLVREAITRSLAA